MCKTKNKKNQATARQGLYVWILIMQIRTMASNDISLTAPKDFSLTAQTKRMTASDLKALGLNKSLFENIVSITDIGQIIINEETLIFEQKLNFELIFEELLKARQLIQTLNPNVLSDLVRLSGADVSFKISNSLSSAIHASAKCFENSGIQITFEEFIASKIRTNKTILLNNRIFISEGNIKCISNKNSKLGIHCLSDWTNWAIGAGLNFLKTDKEFYSHLIANYKNTVLYLSIENGKMTVGQDQTGYTICRMLNQDKDYKEIIKVKYYENMSIMVENLIDQYMLKLYSLEAAFLRTIDNELLSTDYLMPVTEICTVVKKATFSHCVGMTVETNDNWNEFFTSLKDRFLDIDNAIIKFAQIFAKECSKTTTINQDFVYKYYEHFLPMLKKLSKLRSTYRENLERGKNGLSSTVYTLNSINMLCVCAHTFKFP
jgi:hypothetical protein